MRKSTFPNIVSPGFGVSASGRERCLMTEDGGGDFIAVQQINRILHRGGVGNRGAGCNCAWVVEGDVGDRQRHNFGRGCGLRQSATLDGGEMFANRIDFGRLAHHLSAGALLIALFSSSEIPLAGKASKAEPPARNKT